MDPEERNRQRQVCEILLELAEQTEAASLDTLCDQPQAAD
jgi:hypothetical protein